jgi:putative aldouronate transport system substrate-binding protein
MKIVRMNLLAVFLLTVLVSGVFGAGQKSGAGAGAGQDAQIKFNKTGYPITGEKVRFSAIGVFKTVREPNSMPILRHLEKVTNVSLEWTVYTPDSLMERKNLMWASGDYPEVVTAGALSETDVLKYGPEGILIELQDLIPQYMPNFMKVKETEFPDIQSVITLQNGKIYSLPRIVPDAATGTGFYINKTWLDKLGLKVPETTDDFIEVLRAFRDNDVNGNGNKNDEIPFSWDNPNFHYGLGGLMGMFGKAGASTLTGLVIENGKVVWPLADPAFKECVAFLARLYQENLIDPEVFTQDQAAFYAKGKGKDQVYGSVATWRTGLVVGDNEKKNDYVLLPPLKYKNASPEWIHSTGWGINRSAAGLTNKCKSPEIMLKFLDYLYESYWGIQAWIGMVGQNVEYKDGLFHVLPDPPEYSSHMDWYDANVVQWLPAFVSKEDMTGLYMAAPGDLQQLEKAKVYEPYFKNVHFPIVWMTPEQNEAVSPVLSDLNIYVRRMIASWVSGEQDVNATWNQYLGQLENLGIRKYMDLYQGIYDKMKK